MATKRTADPRRSRTLTKPHPLRRLGGQVRFQNGWTRHRAPLRRRFAHYARRGPAFCGSGAPRVDGRVNERAGRRRQAAAPQSHTAVQTGGERPRAGPPYCITGVDRMACGHHRHSGTGPAARGGASDRYAGAICSGKQVSMYVVSELTRPQRLHCLAKLTREARRLTILKPTRVENEVDSEFSCKGGKLQVTSTRFKTRVLATRNQVRLRFTAILQSTNARPQRIEVESTVEGKTSTFSGKTVFVNGRAARILLNTAFQGDTIRVTTVGRERPTRAEEQRADVVLKTLQQTCTLLEHPFFQAIWLPHELDAAAGAAWKRVPRPKREVSLYFPDRTLNDSQARAVRAILSTKDRDRLVLVQGPPGTGKTTVIAAAVTSILESVDYDRTVWVVAQSNVAVKNIAEKLADAECNFTLVVSKDFHYDWHEHLYGEIMDNVVRSDDLSDDIFGVEQRLVGSRVVLCTLSMLSNPKLSLIIRFVPLETLIVDEASQVEIGDFLPMLYHFSKTLQKLVCIGDDKQLPPFGQNNIYSLQSIFEIEHLRKRAIFLDTQCKCSLLVFDQD
ncbi:hypothetical protein C8R43DRAFT_65515 [Mycena crocata]|nr:hypothetical protein C8R43DRAFT_65515 [Mycena crocata]